MNKLLIGVVLTVFLMGCSNMNIDDSASDEELFTSELTVELTLLKDKLPSISEMEQTIVGMTRDEGIDYLSKRYKEADTIRNYFHLIEKIKPGIDNTSHIKNPYHYKIIEIQTLMDNFLNSFATRVYDSEGNLIVE